MKISQLEFILAVEETGSINLAANRLFVSQSLVSTSIIQLEEELGKPIFFRTNKGITLTAFGKEFLPYARSVITQIDQMKSLGKDKITPTNSVTICNNDFRLGARVAAELYNRHGDDKISITFKDCSRQECIDMVSNHLAELAVGRIWSFQNNVISKQISAKNVRFYPLIVVPIAVAVGPKHPLYHHPEPSISLSMLQDYSPVICDYTQYNPIPNVYDQLPELRIKSHITVSSKDTEISLLQSTDIYAITAEYADPEKNTISDWPGCRILEIADCNYHGQIGWFQHKYSDLSPLAQEYVDLLSSHLNSR